MKKYHTIIERKVMDDVECSREILGGHLRIRVIVQNAVGSEGLDLEKQQRVIVVGSSACF